MGFIIVYYKKLKPLMTRTNNTCFKLFWCRWHILALGLLISMTSQNLFAQANQQKPGVESFNFELSTEAQEAVNNGVTLLFDLELAIRQSYWLFTTEKLSKHHQFKLVRQALSSRYIVKQDTLDTPHLFRTILQASGYITEHSISLLGSYSEDGQQYSMRLSLNKYKLPGPMRLNAFISDSWDLDTGWIVWQSAR